ncbi:MAG: glycosyltransferase family 4 protein [Planctomycetota bacterium]
MSGSGLSVLAFGAWDRGPGYPRAGGLIAGLRKQGAEVHECHLDLPHAGTGKRRLVGAPWRWPGYLLALRCARKQAVRTLAAAVETHQPDLLLVPYPGHVTVRWARSVFRGPIVLDLFLSAHDTVVSDRNVFHPASPWAWLLKRLDRRACQAADLVLVDTPQNADHLAALLRYPRAAMDWVPVSDPDEQPQALRYPVPQPGDRLEVLFVGTGVPLHGLLTLLEAVDRCRTVRLTLIGGGPEDRALARRMGADKVRLLDTFVPPDVVRGHLAHSHVVAGIFGISAKARRVIPLKVMLALSTGRPVVTAHTPAVHGLLRPGMDCLVVPPGDVGALARVLQGLADDPAPLQPLADAARHTYERSFSLTRTGSRLVELCEGLVGLRKPTAGEPTSVMPEPMRSSGP